MRIFRLLPHVILCLFLAAAASAQAPKFLSVIDDLPLMPGLTEDTDAGMVFDGPTGRIVEAFAAGGVTAEAVRGYYLQTLPQLGWTRKAPGLFQRDDEVLKLEVAPAAAGAGVHFTLRPAGS